MARRARTVGDDPVGSACYYVGTSEWTPVNLSTPTKPSTKTFHLILIKPSHYDDEGYVIQWMRSSIPSNTMAAIYDLRGYTKVR